MADLGLTGYDAVLGYAAGSTAAPVSGATLTTIEGARDVNVTISCDKVEQSDRSSRFKRYCPSMIDIEVTAEVTYNAATQPFIENCIDRDILTIGVLEVATGSGLYFNAQCFSADLALPLADGQTISLTFAPVKESGVGAGGPPVWG